MDNYVPTQEDARLWAARMIATHQFDWDTIAEGAHPDGINLEQDGCNVMAEALYSCTLTFTWPDDMEIVINRDAR